MIPEEEEAGFDQLHLLAIVLLAAGLLAVVFAFALNKPWSSSELVYDIGLGLLLATAISFVLERYVRGLEKREQERREQEQRVAESAQEWMEEFQRNVAETLAVADKALAHAREGERMSEILELRVLVLAMHADVKLIARRIDPNYEESETDAKVSRLYEVIKQNLANEHDES